MAVANQTPAREPFWTRVLRTFRAIDEALHYDPIVGLDQRVSRLEKQLACLTKDDGGRRSGGGEC